ncbi:OmpH family outer membrane protein [Frigidibacter sp. MR17.24]|uniref:OmpH family outer membrane protein n=1 Tax=Frigidibacter sp. MR17.24 TaxID=3127345 RepID=UPI003012FB45
MALRARFHRGGGIATALVASALVAAAALWPLRPPGAAAQSVDFGSGAFSLGAAVDGPAPAAPAPLLILDEERLFTQSRWGRRVQAEFDADAADLQAENRRLESDLATEERSLADRRPTMPADSFRAAADSFDERVVGIRQAQEAKARALTSRRDAERRAFFSAAVPALRDLLRQRGAAAIVDARVVLLSLNSLDVTDAAVQAVDARLGDGPPRSANPDEGDQPAGQSTEQPAGQSAEQPADQSTGQPTGQSTEQPPEAPAAPPPSGAAPPP